MREYLSPTVGTDKRERQKIARQEKIEQLRAAEHRQATRKRGLGIATFVVLFVVAAIAFSVLTADDGDDDVSATGTTLPSDAVDTDTDTDAAPLPCPTTDGSQVRVVEFPAAPDMCIDPAKQYTATMVTDVGTVVIELDAEAAPLTVNNFVYLARYKYYDGLTFHRVIPDFVIQGGDPAGNGSGGPGYRFADELPQPEDYGAGSLAMANSGVDTNGSQFFVVTSENGARTLVEAVGGTANYSLFGQVVEGMDVVAAIEGDGTPAGSPTVVHRIESVTITES